MLQKSTLNHDTFCWKYCTFSSQMYTNAEHELRTASMNSHSNALLLDGVIHKFIQHCFLMWHVSWKNSNLSYYRSTNVTLHEDVNFTWYTIHHKPNQNKTESQKHTPEKKSQVKYNIINNAHQC